MKKGGVENQPRPLMLQNDLNQRTLGGREGECSRCLEKCNYQIKESFMKNSSS